MGKVGEKARTAGGCTLAWVATAYRVSDLSTHAPAVQPQHEFRLYYTGDAPRPWHVTQLTPIDRVRMSALSMMLSTFRTSCLRTAPVPSWSVHMMLKPRVSELSQLKWSTMSYAGRYAVHDWRLLPPKTNLAVESYTTMVSWSVGRPGGISGCLNARIGF
jgi:hypothetical protein